MEITRDKEGFKPVIIVLTSPEEVDAFSGMVKAVRFDGKSLEIIDRNMFYSHFIYRFLNELHTKLNLILKGTEKK